MKEFTTTEAFGLIPEHPMQPIFDLEKILKPFDGENPSGPSLFYEPIYDAIEQERREDDPSLPQGVWEHELKRADWGKVLTLCRETLELQSKDLQIAAWMTEAATKLYAVRGLLEGIKCLRNLSERFWDTIHPQMKEDDLEFRLSPLEWCDSILSQRLRETPLCQVEVSDNRTYFWTDWVDAEHWRHIQKRTDSQASSEKATTAALLDAVDATESGFYVDLSRDLTDLTEELTLFSSYLHEKLGETATTFSRLRKETNEIHRTVKKWLRERKGMDIDTITQNVPLEKSETAETTSNSATISKTVNTDITSRNEAYALLEKAADILTKCEPHSPVPHLIRRLASWKNKSLDELLNELNARDLDLSVLQKIFRDIG